MNRDPEIVEAFDVAIQFFQSGKTDKALAKCHEIVQLHPDDPESMRVSALFAEKSGNLPLAIKWAQQGIRLAPCQSEPHLILGNMYAQSGQKKKALRCFQRAIEINPESLKARHSAGTLLLNKGNVHESMNHFKKIVQKNPLDWRAWINLCFVFRELGELNEARDCGRRATRLNSQSFHAWHNQANVFLDMARFTEAILFYEKALELKPESEATLIGLGIACHQEQKTDKAIEYFERGLKKNPKQGTAICNLLNIAMMECNWSKTKAYGEALDKLTVDALQRGAEVQETPFVNICRHDDVGFNLAVAQAWSRDIAKKMSEMGHSLGFQYARKRREKIRIGYLSNNFGDHPTAQITRRLYQLHDRTRFEVYCFSYGAPDNSHYRDSIRRDCDKFVDIRKLSHARSAKAINDLRVDILVDLVGFMKGERTAIAALRPAPVQIRWLGMAGTSGADFYDYLITDRVVTPQGQETFYAEKLVYMPYCYQINDNRPYKSGQDFQRSDFGLPEDGFVFCCFNTSYKLDEVTFTIWMNILKRVPGSVLWLMANSGRMKGNLKKAAIENGVDARRLIFADKLPKHRHLSRLSLADLVLDTRMVNGAASTSDALWAGVPVLTFQGNHFASRMASSILNAVGLPDLITYSMEEYEEQAVKLSNESNLLAKMQSVLTNGVCQSSLFDTEGAVCNLEKAYELIWQRHLDGKKPCAFDVVEHN